MMQDKVILITGGTSGIGLKAAEIFLKKGAGVVISGRDKDRGEKALAALRLSCPAGKTAFFPCDVTNTADCSRLVSLAAEAFGGIDVLVNSAGIYQEKALEDISEEDYSLIMDVNFKGTCFMTKAALPELKKRKGASVVNLSSDAGVQGNYLCSLYCASKGAVTMFTRAMALELAPYGIRINCVCPGDILTPLTERQLAGAPERDAALREMASVYPLGRIGTADEAAAVVVFLASEEASFVTGAAWSVDGGITA